MFNPIFYYIRSSKLKSKKKAIIVLLISRKCQNLSGEFQVQGVQGLFGRLKTVQGLFGRPYTLAPGEKNTQTPPPS